MCAIILFVQKTIMRMALMDFLLPFLYVIFISLGLPDSLFGVAWPVMHEEMNVSESFGSVYQMVVGFCTAGISLIAGKLLRRYGTARVTYVSIILTVIGLIGMSYAKSLIFLIFFAVVLGYGAGAIDTGLNSYVSTHYHARHMNWLHCFWGIGVALSPLIMSFSLTAGVDTSWRGGYRTVGILQACILIAVTFIMRKWIKREETEDLYEETRIDTSKEGILQIFRKKGVLLSVISLGVYCGMEYIIGTWGASYMVNVFDMEPASAARWVSLYYTGIMIGRFASGFFSIKFHDDLIISFGIFIASLAAGSLCFSMGSLENMAFFIIGLGFAPIFPCILHSIPNRFGTEYSADITGYHTFGAYGIGFMIQFAFGIIASTVSFNITPFVLLGLSLTFIALNFLVLKKTGLLKKRYILGIKRKKNRK